MNLKSIVSLILISIGSFLTGLEKGPEIEAVRTLDKSVSFRGIHAVDQNRVWVCGSRGTLYYVDAGINQFKKIKIPQGENLDFRDLAVLDNTAILVMSAGTGEKSRIYRSTDGGKKFSLVYQMPYKYGFLNSMAFWNSRSGLAVGDPVKGSLFIMVTNDGGKTWKENERLEIPSTQAGEAGFAASGTCVAVYGKQLAWIGTGGKIARIFRSHNGGRTWMVSDTPILQGQSSTGIFSVFFSNAGTGLAVGGDYRKEAAKIRTAAYTRDGGLKWIQVKDGMVPFLSCVGEVLYSNRPGYIATGPEGTYFSRNGIDWSKLSKHGYHCLSVSQDKKSAWLAGSGGRIGRIIF